MRVTEKAYGTAPRPFVTWHLPSSSENTARAPSRGSLLSRSSRVVRVDSVLHQLAQFVVMAVTMSVVPDSMATKWTQ